MTDKRPVTRRDFLQTTGAAAGAVVAASTTFAHPAIGSVKGANEKINFAILGPGGRAQAHIGHLLNMKKEGKLVDIIGMCDVWDGGPTRVSASGKGSEARGLYPSADRASLKHDDKLVTKDYRKILESKDVDAVVVATPDHWHAKMAIDAMDAGKDVYSEKPMCHTIDEARRITETQARTKQIFTVGVQSTASPIWKMANDVITSGKIGHVMQAQTSYYRNSSMGQWRYYGLTEDMNPKTIDWKMFLGTEFGLAPDQPFDRAKYAQWRCYWDFGGGMYTDLFVHQLTHLIQAVGVKFPSRVVGAGGLYLEYDGRDVPDVATVVADYDQGCQIIISATMANDVQLGEVIRGHTGTIRFEGENAFRVIPRRSPAPRPSPAPTRARAASCSRPRSTAAGTRTPGPSGITTSAASARGTPRPSARPRPDTPPSPPSTSASTRTASARLITSTRRPTRSPRPTTSGPRSGRRSATTAASPSRSSAGRPTPSRAQP